MKIGGDSAIQVSQYDENSGVSTAHFHKLRENSGLSTAQFHKTMKTEMPLVFRTST